MKIILDFDYTIFDTDKFRGAVQAMFAKHGVGTELFKRSIEESRGEAGEWHPVKQFEILKKEGIDKINSIRETLNRLTDNSQQYLYEDTMPFLEKASKNNEFSVVSYGEDKFQGAKIRGCGEACKYFNKILVTQNLNKDKEAGEVARGDRAIFIEDNPMALAAVKKLSPNIITVRMNRGEGRHATLPSGEGIDYHVRNLLEVETVLANF